MSRKAASAPPIPLGDTLSALVDAFADRVALRLAAKIAPANPSPSTTKVPDFLAEGEVSRRTGLSIRTLQGWRARGKGPAFVHAGRRILYPVAGVEDFLRSGSKPRPRGT